MQTLQVTTADGVCPVVVVTPEDDGPHPAVVLFMDAGGVRPALVEMAERLAADGHTVFVPELYYRHGAYPPFDASTVFTDPPERGRLMALAGSLRPDEVVRDVGSLLEAVAGHPAVRGSAVGCTGYCMGGAVALRAAAAYPQRVAAAASFHGGNLATEDPASPHRSVGTVRARVYAGIARDDASCPPEQQERLAAALREAGVEARLEQYDALHGFAVPDNPTYDESAAQRHDDVLRELFAEL